MACCYTQRLTRCQGRKKVMRVRRILSTIWLICLLFLIGPVSAVTNVNAKTVRVAVCPHTPPFQFLDENYYLTGIHIDIMEEIAQQNNLSIIYTTYNTKSECISALNRGVVDMVLGYQTQEYDITDHLVTSELSTGTISIVANKNLAAYIEQTQRTTPFAIAFEYGAIDYSLLHALGFHRLLGVGNQDQAVDALLSQEADITVGLSESISYILHQRGIEREFTTIHGRVSAVQFAILVSKESPSLYRLLDKALIELHTSGVYEKICDFWIRNQSEQRLQFIVNGLIVTALLTILITAVVLWFNHVLRKRVGVKTKMLYEVNQSLEQTITRLQNEDMFRNQMIDSLPVAAILFDLGFTVTLMNPMAHMLCGLDKTDESCTDAKRLPVFGYILQRLNHTIFSPDPQIEQKRIFELRDGNTIYKYRCWIHRLVEGTHFAGALMMVENITQEELRRKELFAMEKANTLNQLVAGIAHEIKNPLMTIKTAVSLMASRWEDSNVRSAFLQFIPDEVDRMNSLVEGLLNYAKPPGEAFSVFRMSEPVRRSFGMAKITDNTSRIQFTISLDEDLYICAQRDLLRQALTNLLINSMWAVNKKWENAPLEGWNGSISCRVYAEGDWVCLSVYDDGIGMSDDVLIRCTEPFFTTKLAGTGLGMALVKQFVENSGGTLLIHSVENQFTEILIRFPRHLTD